MNIIREKKIIGHICDEFGFIFLATMVVVNDTNNPDIVDLDFIFEYDNDELPFEIIQKNAPRSIFAKYNLTKD